MSRRLLIDLDGTVVDLMGYGLHLGYFDHLPCRWDFTGCCSKFTANAVFSSTHMFRNAPPLPGALDGVRALMEHFDVRFVSTPWPTNHATAQAKYEWVEEHFGDPTLLTLTHDKTLIEGWALIDDKPGLVGPWAHVEYPQPWNEQSWPTWLDGLALLLVAGAAAESPVQGAVCRLGAPQHPASTRTAPNPQIGPRRPRKDSDAPTA